MSAVLLRECAVFFLLALFCAASLRAGEDEFKDIREIRALETYVPYDEFLKLTGNDKNATVMTLEEYRALVELATARYVPRKIAPPPIEISLMEATYTGRTGEFSVRFDAQFKIVATSDKWMRCDLGPVQNLGHVTLDGKPGWVVLENNRATLLLKGKGLHTGSLAFALPLKNEDDVQKLSAKLLNAASGQVTITVPGRATPRSAAGALDATYDAATEQTTFSLPVVRDAAKNDTPALEIQWARKYDSQKNDALLACEHHVSYLLNPASPYFYWQANVQISRRKAAELTFAEPPGCRVVRLAGTGVHSWVRENGLLHVLLDNPELGEVSIAASGIVEVPTQDFVLGAPELKDAQRNARTLALYEPPEGRITILDSTGLRELAQNERPASALFKAPDWDGRLAHVFFVEQTNAKLKVRVVHTATIFDTRTTAVLNIDEKFVTLRCTLSVLPERGRLFNANLTVPAEWKLSDVRERGTGRGVFVSPRDEGKEDNFTLRFSDSTTLTQPFELDALFVLRDLVWAESSWSAHDLNLALPSINGARRSETHLAIVVHPSIDVSFGAMPVWRSDVPGTLARTGLSESAIRAGLATESANATLNLSLSHPSPRGEYESVLHLLTVEHEQWLRADIRVLALERARAVDELILELPANVAEPLYINGEGVREVAPGANATQRIVRFEQPWRNVRMLRVEYRAPLAPDTDVPIPDVRVLGQFDARRRIVFQSAGVVSLEVKPGNALLTASLDDTPYFATPFKTGRALFAFTYGPGANIGTFRTKNLETSPVLGNLVRSLNLSTLVDGSGILRTHAEFILAYSQQYVETALPSGAKLLSLCVDGESVRPVQGGQADALRIPLPSRSTARVELVYERSLGALGNFGSIEEGAPRFSEFPVIETKWSIYYPTTYACEFTGGNLTPLTPHKSRYFLSEFADSLSAGVLPVFTAWRNEERGERAVFETAPRTQNDANIQKENSQALKSLEAAAARPPLKDRCIGALAIPEGAVLKAEKLGGSARFVLAYRGIEYSTFARRSVFLLALLAGAWLMLRVSFRSALLYTVAGLLLGALIPAALKWESPLLCIPFCEGVLAFALLLGAAYASHALRRLLQRRSAVRAAAACLAFTLITAELRAGEVEPVLIPYPKEGALPVSADPKNTKVYVPKAVYLDLMKRVKPEKKEPEIDAPRTLEPKPAIVPFALGNADYELNVDEKSYFIKGTLLVTTFNPKGWATVPLDAGPTQLISVKLDGKPAGVSNRNGHVSVELQGAKTFTLELELRGPLELEAGRARLNAQVVVGGATRLTAILPGKVEVDSKALPPGAWISKDADGNMQRCELALGTSGAFALSWHSPDIRGQGERRLSSHSYTQFALAADGYSVARVERVAIDGPASEQLAFHVLGGWDISNVTATGLAEWSVSGAGAARVLRLWYHKPINESSIQIVGWAPLGAEPAPAAGLSLENAVRQEGFIGLKHGEGRRFSTATLADLKRASQEELAAAVTLPENTQPDRILHYNGAPEKQTVIAELETADVSLDTQFMGVLRENTLTVGARIRYTVIGRGPLRYDVELPPNWEIRTVRASTLRDWEVTEINGKRHLVIDFGTHATSGTEVRWSAEMPLALPANGALRLDLPQPRAVADAKTNQTIEWLLAADSALSLSQQADTTMQPLPVDRARRWVNLEPGQDWRLAFRSSKADTRLSIDVSRQDSALYATVVTFVNAAEEHVQVVARIRYRIERAGRDRFELRLPVNAELLSIEGRNIRGRELKASPSGTALTVMMQSPVTGEQIIDLAYRLPREAGKDARAEGPSIEDAGARGAEHFAGLLPSEDLLADTSLLNPLKDVESLPFVPANISKQALAKVFSADQGWSMTLRRNGLQAETGQAAEVRAELTTAIASDGGVRSEATYAVRNRSLQFMAIEMPADAQVWAVTVDGRPASVSKRGTSTLLIPLQRMTETDTPARVQIVYESAPAALPALYTSYTPRAPKVLDVPVVESHWRIYVPEGYAVGRSGGNVKEVVSGVLYSIRVDSNVNEITRLAKIADAPNQNPLRRRRALQNIAGQQQELNDNVILLGNERNNAAEEAQRFSRDDLMSQTQFNNYNFSNGNLWQGKLNESARKKQIESAMSGTLDPEQVREFFDHYNFLNIRWRNGALSKKEPQDAPPSPDEMSADDLRYLLRIGGYRAGEIATPTATPPPALTENTPSPSMLSEDKLNRLFIDNGTGGFDFNEKRASDLRMTHLNFRSVEAHPELTLTFRAQDASVRGPAWAALIVLALAAFIFRKRLKSVFVA